MNRRTFMQLGAGAAAASMIPLSTRPGPEWQWITIHWVSFNKNFDSDITVAFVVSEDKMIVSRFKWTKNDTGYVPFDYRWDFWYRGDPTKIQPILPGRNNGKLIPTMVTPPVGEHQAADLQFIGKPMTLEDLPNDPEYVPHELELGNLLDAVKERYESETDNKGFTISS